MSCVAEGCYLPPRRIRGDAAFALYSKLKHHLEIVEPWRDPVLLDHLPCRGLKARQGPGCHRDWPLHAWEGKGLARKPLVLKWVAKSKRMPTFIAFCRAYNLEVVDDTEWERSDEARIRSR